MVRVSSYSEVGGHRLNEDVLAVHQHETEPDLWLCFVADGQGGSAGGGPAARLACDVALEASRKYSPTQLRNARQWSSLLRLADNKVLEDPVAGFTTLVGLGLYRGQIVGVSSGDSGALLVDEHAAVELTASQRKNPPVGSGVAEAVTFAATAQGDWLLLVMTDGVWKYVGWNRIIEIARRKRGTELLAELQEAARLPGSGQFQDDFTIVLLEESDRNAVAA